MYRLLITATKTLSTASLLSTNHPPQALSWQEHDTITKTKLIPKRTQAKQRSEVADPSASSRPRQTDINAPQVIDVVRKNSLNYPPGTVCPRSRHYI